MLPIGERPAFWKQRVLRDPALEPIRNETGFVRLLPKE
jgi:hypothetical protein